MRKRFLGPQGRWDQRDDIPSLYGHHLVFPWSLSDLALRSPIPQSECTNDLKETRFDEGIP